MPNTKRPANPYRLLCYWILQSKPTECDCNTHIYILWTLTVTTINWITLPTLIASTAYWRNKCISLTSLNEIASHCYTSIHPYVSTKINIPVANKKQATHLKPMNRKLKPNSSAYSKIFKSPFILFNHILIK